MHAIISSFYAMMNRRNTHGGKTGNLRTVRQAIAEEDADLRVLRFDQDGENVHALDSHQLAVPRVQNLQALAYS